MNNTLQVKKGASQSLDPQIAARELRAAIDQPDIRFALFYCSPDYDLESLSRSLAEEFGSVPLIGCTTAGEITPIGYLDGSITGVSIASEDVFAVTTRVDRMADFEFNRGEQVAQTLVQSLESTGRSAAPEKTFAFLLVDGLCMKEEQLVSALHRNLGNVQLFGGSAGDGVRFQKTYIYHDGAFHTDCAVLTLVHTEHPFMVFKTQHFLSSEKRLVVTEADPSQRLVTEINGEPAGREYARMVGLEVDKLTPLIFSTYPVVVKVGGAYYVRSIQKVNEDESLTFFCAIEEGIVLTVAQGVDLVENLEELFADVHAQVGPPELVLGCDCILRNLEIGQRDIKDQVADIMMRNNVVGFATYGEQYNAMHVNQTFTGVAIGARSAGT